MKGCAFVNSKVSAFLSRRRLERRDQPENQEKYSERLVIKEFNV
jgi:hypothetical protein